VPVVDCGILGVLVNGESNERTSETVRELVGIVSRNGNVLPNAPVRADGALDGETVSVREAIGGRLSANGHEPPGSIRAPTQAGTRGGPLGDQGRIPLGVGKWVA